MDEQADIRSIRLGAFSASQRFLLAEIDSLGSNGSRIIFRKLLYLSFLDSLARLIFPRKGNRDRVVELLRHFSDWKDGSRVSLPHLDKVTRLTPEPGFGSLRRFVSERLEAWRDLGVVSIEKDPELDEVRGRWSRQDGPVPLESLQHYSLFYAERNRIVHELHTKSLDLPIPMPEQPFYSRVSFPDAKIFETQSTWALFYPIEFYRKLAEETFSRVEAYLRENEIDVYAGGAFSYYWVDQLQD